MESYEDDASEVSVEQRLTYVRDSAYIRVTRNSSAREGLAKQALAAILLFTIIYYSSQAVEADPHGSYIYTLAQ